MFNLSSIAFILIIAAIMVMGFRINSLKNRIKWLENDLNTAFPYVELDISDNPDGDEMKYALKEQEINRFKPWLKDLKK